MRGLFQHVQFLGHKDVVWAVAKTDPGIACFGGVGEVGVGDGLFVLGQLEDLVIAIGFGPDLFDDGGGPAGSADPHLGCAVAIGVENRHFVGV